MHPLVLYLPSIITYLYLKILNSKRGSHRYFYLYRRSIDLVLFVYHVAYIIQLSIFLRGLCAFHRSTCRSWLPSRISDKKTSHAAQISTGRFREFIPNHSILIKYFKRFAHLIEKLISIIFIRVFIHRRMISSFLSK
jgi:hypothetical protein